VLIKPPSEVYKSMLLHSVRLILLQTVAQHAHRPNRCSQCQFHGWLFIIKPSILTKLTNFHPSMR